MKKKVNYMLSLLSLIVLLANSLSVSAANVGPMIGDEEYIYIDVQELIAESDEESDIKFSRAAEMPTQTWDWSQGMYSGKFEIEHECSYTRYNFTGTSELNVTVCASRDIYTAASDVYFVNLLSDTGKLLSKQEFNSTSWKGVKFYNMDPAEKYVVCFEKADDGSVLTGFFNVYLSE